MSPIERILVEARRLSARDRRRLLSKIEETLAQADRAGVGKRSRRKNSLAPLLALSGTAHSKATDVSSNKHAHLAEIHAAKTARGR